MVWSFYGNNTGRLLTHGGYLFFFFWLAQVCFALFTCWLDGCVCKLCFALGVFSLFSLYYYDGSQNVKTQKDEVVAVVCFAFTIIALAEGTAQTEIHV